jgi:hypothetical protein
MEGAVTGIASLEPKVLGSRYAKVRLEIPSSLHHVKCTPHILAADHIFLFSIYMPLTRHKKQLHTQLAKLPSFWCSNC